MLLRMGTRFVGEEICARTDKIVQVLADSDLAERRLPARPRTQCGAMAVPAVIDAKNNDALVRSVESVEKMCGARAGINSTRMGHEAGNNGPIFFRRAVRSQRTSLKTVLQERSEFRSRGWVKRSCNRGRPNGGHLDLVKKNYGATTSTSNVPLPSISPSTLSPGLRNTGGTRAKPTPEGVPVLMISPGSSVIPAERLSMVVGISKIMSRVLPSCITSPLTRQMRRTC